MQKLEMTHLRAELLDTSISYLINYCDHYEREISSLTFGLSMNYTQWKIPPIDGLIS